MEEPFDGPSGEPSSTASSVDESIVGLFDWELFHFLTQGVFLGSDLDEQVIDSFVNIVYTKGVEHKVDRLLDRFCTPQSMNDQLLAADIAALSGRKD